MIGIETRLQITQEEKVFIDDFLYQCNRVAHQAYQRVQKGLLLSDNIYAFITRQGFTSAQANSIQSQIEQWISLDKTHHKQREKVLTETIEGLEKSLKNLVQEKEILEKKVSLSKKDQEKITYLKRSIFHKHRRLLSKKEALEKLVTEKPHRVFGGKKLLKQRSDIKNQADLTLWKQNWKQKRYEQMCFIGRGDKPYGNPTIQINPYDNTLTLRLTETQANARIQAEAERLNKSFDKVPQRLMFKRIILLIQFEKMDLLKQAQALNLPITISIYKKLTPSGKRRQRQGKALLEKDRAYYVHASFELPKPEVIHKRNYGVLGIDQNAWGLAWCMVKPDGNVYKHEGKVLKGILKIKRNGKTKEQIQAQVHQHIQTLTDLAERFHVAIAIEALDFFKARTQSREKGKTYARMISTLNTSQFKELLQTKCRKQGIALHQVDPRYTSVLGFAKYGLRNNFSVDQAGAFMIGRKGALGKIWKPFPVTAHDKNGNPYSNNIMKKREKRQEDRLFNQVIYYNESVNPAQPIPLSDQSSTRIRLSQVGWGYRNWQKVLGVNRHLWPKILSSVRLWKTTLKAHPATAKKLAPYKLPCVGGDEESVQVGKRLEIPVVEMPYVPISTDLVNG
jgi:IS605 OrfB family transposase